MKKKQQQQNLKFNKYYDYDDAEYRRIRDIENLFDENYYKPIKNKSAFNDNYIEHESKGDKDENLLLKEYLYINIPYLRDITNDHKTLMEYRVRLVDKIIDYKNQFGELKIQLTNQFYFF